MSYFCRWHLIHGDEAVEIHDPTGFLIWVNNLDNTDFEGMKKFIAYGYLENVVEETATRKVFEKVYMFYGFHLKDDAPGGSINHFDPTKDDVLKFVGELSQFTGDLTFLVEVEGWPSLDPGYLFVVRAHKGRATVKSAWVEEAQD